MLGIMCIKYAEFILDTPFGPPQSRIGGGGGGGPKGVSNINSCLRSYASDLSLLVLRSGPSLTRARN